MNIKAVVIALLVALAAVGGFYLLTSEQDSGLKPVSLRNPIPAITTGQTPLVVAREKGFFQKNGLDVTLKQGSRELNPVKMVSVGQDTFGMMGGIESLIVARSKGIKVKAIATLHRDANFVCLISLKDRNINTLADLQGKRVGFFYGHISTDVLRPLFKQEGVEVTEVNVGFDYNQLLTGQLDAQWGFTVRAALLLPMQGYDINVMSPKEYGIVTHGYTLFAMEDFVNEHPDTVDAFLTSVVEGVQYSLANPEESIDVLLGLNDSLERDFALQSQAVFDSVTSNSSEHPIGYMDREMFESAYQRLLAEGLLESEFDVADLFTTAPIERVHRQLGGVTN